LPWIAADIFLLEQFKTTETSVAEPKLFVSAPALAQTYKKFRLQLGLQLGRYLFTQLLDQNVEFS
jgi:hypothetical protein